MTSRRFTCAALVALALVPGSCGRASETHKATAAPKLEKLLAEQRAAPVQRPAVQDRHDLAPTTTERWRWPSPDGGNLGLPATDRRGVVTTHTERFLVALDNDGRLAWSVEHQRLRPVEPLLVGDLVVAAGEDDVLAVDRATGVVRWVAPIGPQRANAPGLAGDAVIVTTWEGRMLALDLASGVVRWSVTLDGRSLWRPAAADQIVVAVWDGGWGGFDLADGKTRWQADLWPEGMGSPAIASPKTGRPIAIVTSGGRIDANDLSTGKQRWRTTTWVDTAIDQNVTVLDPKRATVAIPDRDGGVTVLDAATGELQWFRAGVEGDLAERGSPAPLGEGVLAFALDEGGVRLAWPGGDRDVDVGALVAGVARLGDGLVVTTWQSDRPSVVALDVLTRAKSR